MEDSFVICIAASGPFNELFLSNTEYNLLDSYKYEERIVEARVLVKQMKLDKLHTHCW